MDKPIEGEVDNLTDEHRVFLFVKTEIQGKKDEEDEVMRYCD